jgi:branched-chain amino acid transport system ATP-binding protein
MLCLGSQVFAVAANLQTTGPGPGAAAPGLETVHRTEIQGLGAMESKNKQPGDPVLLVTELAAGYGDLAAIRDVSFSLHPGEIVALFGPNGAGKTTTLMATVGQLPRMSGTVSWRGRHAKASLHQLSREGLAYVPEERSVISSLSAQDNLRLGRGGVAGAVEHFPELQPLLRRKGGLLSGGEQQMLMLARALAAKPRALLVDELSLGLAPLMVERLFEAVRKAAKEEGLAVLLVEQQARRALSVADRWYLLNNGSVVREGSGDQGSELENAYFASRNTATEHEVSRH